MTQARAHTFGWVLLIAAAMTVALWYASAGVMSLATRSTPTVSGSFGPVERTADYRATTNEWYAPLRASTASADGAPREGVAGAYSVVAGEASVAAGDEPAVETSSIQVTADGTVVFSSSSTTVPPPPGTSPIPGPVLP